MNTLSSPQGAFELSRYPIRRNETLRAWDAADEYILNHLHEEQRLSAGTSILIINDQFGGLAVPLAEFSPTVISDSWLAHAGIQENAQRNQVAEGCISLHTSLDYPDTAFDIVLIKVPKSLAMLEDQLIRLAPCLHNNSIVIAAGMVKAIHTSTLKLFEKYLGATKTSLAKKKARLIFPTLSAVDTQRHNPYPSRYILEGTDYEITNHAGVFSRESLDIGTRFFLAHLPRLKEQAKVIDLGCGNGIVGLMAAHHNPSAEMTFVDESFMAIASAKETFEKAFSEDRNHNRQAHFVATDCLGGLAHNHYDCILNNPPFHQQNAVGDFIAMQMFYESKQALSKQGELYVIGNRHLGYHVKLKKLFGNCTTVASNKKFVILKSIKTH